MRAMLRSAGLAVGLMAAAVAWGQSPFFLSESQLDAVALLPDPPSEQSPETRAELDLLLRVQQRRTPEEIARAKADASLTMAAFADVIGPWFTPENLPRMEQLFQKLQTEATHVGGQAKNHFARKRPRFLDDRIQPVLAGISDPSYPSGNATRGMLCAAVLAEVAPQQRPAIMERGRELGWNRVVAGVHYPSDVTAGRVLGLAIARALLADPKFQQELSQVKKEFAAARKRAG